ncbi:MAG TPA: acyltransferase [Pseudolabrys sp.]
MNQSAETDQQSRRTTAGRLDWLDALRGLAILGVVLVHTGQGVRIESGFWYQITSAGQYGVQLFFIVSAITISITYDSYVDRFGSSFRTAASWFIKRFFRIAPLYYFAIVFYTIEQYAIYIGSHHQYGHLPRPFPDLLANALFIHTWVPSANNTVVPGGWSIGVEVFFYFLVPLIWLITKGQVRALVLGLTIVPMISFSLLMSIFSAGTSYIENNSFLYLWFPAQYPVLAVGLIYFIIVFKPQRQVSTSRTSWLFLVAFLGLFVFGLAFGTLKALAPVLSPFIVSLAFICLIMSLHGVIKIALVNPILIFLGKISYSIYILHFVVLDAYKAASVMAQGISAPSPLWLLVVFPTVVLLTSGLAFLSKRFFEDPGIKFGHRLSNRIVAP